MLRYQLPRANFRIYGRNLSVALDAAVDVRDGDHNLAILAYEFQFWIKISVNHKHIDNDAMLAFGRSLMRGEYWRDGHFTFIDTRIKDGSVVLAVAANQLDEEYKSTRMYVQSIRVELEYTCLESLRHDWHMVTGLADQAVGSFFAGPLRELMPYVVCPGLYEQYCNQSGHFMSLKESLSLTDDSCMRMLVEAETRRLYGAESTFEAALSKRARLFFARIEYPQSPLV